MNNAHFIFVLLLVVSVGQRVLGQGQLSSIGIKAAPQWTTLQGSEVESFSQNNEATIKLNAGAYAEWALTDRLSLLPGLQYNVRGAQSVLANVSLHYLSLPVAVQYRMGNFFVEGGAEASLKLAVLSDSDNAATNDFLKALYNRKSDLGVLAGVGYRYQRLRVGLRLTQGLIYQSDAITFTDANGEPLAGDRRFGRNRTGELWVGVDLWTRE